VFDFTFAEIEQVRPPLRILLEIVRDTFGEQDVSGIAAIHDALRHIDSDTRDIGLFVQIGDLVNRAAMDSHAHLQFRMALEGLANFQRAENRRFQAVAEHERTTITGRQPQKFAFRFRFLELVGAAHDLAQRLDLIALFGDQQLRVTDDIDEQDMPDFELYI
jgi:hypothetical protein